MKLLLLAIVIANQAYGQTQCPCALNPVNKLGTRMMSTLQSHGYDTTAMDKMFGQFKGMQGIIVQQAPTALDGLSALGDWGPEVDKMYDQAKPMMDLMLPRAEVKAFYTKMMTKMNQMVGETDEMLVEAMNAMNPEFTQFVNMMGMGPTLESLGMPNSGWNVNVVSGRKKRSTPHAAELEQIMGQMYDMMKKLANWMTGANVTPHLSDIFAPIKEMGADIDQLLATLFQDPQFLMSMGSAMEDLTKQTSSITSLFGRKKRHTVGGSAIDTAHWEDAMKLWVATAPKNTIEEYFPTTNGVVKFTPFSDAEMAQFMVKINDIGTFFTNTLLPKFGTIGTSLTTFNIQSSNNFGNIMNQIDGIIKSDEMFTFIDKIGDVGRYIFVAMNKQESIGFLQTAMKEGYSTMAGRRRRKRSTTGMCTCSSGFKLMANGNLNACLAFAGLSLTIFN